MWNGPTDTELILLIIGFFYVCECLNWLPRQAVCLTGWIGRWRKAESPQFLGNASRGLVVTSLSPLGRSFTCPYWPVAITPDGCAILAGEHFGEFVRVEDFSTARRFRERISFASGSSIELSDDSSAELLQSLLQEIAAAPNEQREKLINGWLDRQFDEPSIRARVDEALDQSSSSRWLGSMMFLYIFAYGPALYYSAEKLDEWLLLRYLLGFLVLDMSLILIFVIAHRSLFGKSRRGRWKTAFLMLLSPAMSIRSADHLTRSSLENGHPLVVGRDLLRNSEWLRLARIIWNDLTHPLPLRVDSGTGEANADLSSEFEQARSCFATNVRQRILSACERWEVASEALAVIPERDPDAACYCPRCHNQFRSMPAACESCHDLEAIPFVD